MTNKERALLREFELKYVTSELSRDVFEPRLWALYEALRADKEYEAAEQLRKAIEDLNDRHRAFYRREHAAN